MSSNHILITGCSGGGKSTLLNALGGRGFAIVPEPGRRIVCEEKASSGKALPWVDLNAFSKRALAMANDDLIKANKTKDLVFFDRGIIDAALAIQYSGGPAYLKILGEKKHYAPEVFLAPPWPEIYKNDDDRKHGFDEAVDEYERIRSALLELGYNIHMLPKVSVNERVNYVLKTLGK
ncbi:MAG: AAA family ATPase [Lentilitoribacter sp.]